jgi:hypothetical protein
MDMKIGEQRAVTRAALVQVVQQLLESEIR